MNWLKIGIRTQKEAEEILSNVLIGAGATGVTIEGDNKSCIQDGLPWDYLDEKILDVVPFCVAAYFVCDGTEQETLETIKKKCKQLKRMDLGVPLGTLEVITQIVKEEDWENSWKAYFKPVRISDFVIIKPTWEDYAKGDDEVVIEIDPGMAFGTGNHETTRMCVTLLEEFIEEGMTVIDAGCGSGILSIAAAKFGAKKVYAYDLDSVAVDVTAKNAQLNQCEDVIEVKKSDLLAEVPKGTKVDILIANIIADVVIMLNKVAKDYLKVNAMYICSGIIDSRIDDVVKSLEEQKFRIINIMSDGEWRAVACKYKG
ncbi:MAG: 50S ribosomal protein L11 methyltransferase [Christensenellaceae bacterium]